MKTIRDLLKFRQRGRSDAASQRYWIAQRERRARAEAMQQLAEIEQERKKQAQDAKEDE